MEENEVVLTKMNAVNITTDDFFNQEGINLDELLTQVVFSSTPAMQAQVYINKIKSKCERWLCKYYDNTNEKKLTPRQVELYKEGVIHQAVYVLSNGETDQENGFNQETNTIIEIDKIKRFSVEATECFYLAGLMNKRRLSVRM